ncbi:MAG: hypothetical protein HDT39_06550 [Lachnospiraceae bacterium]|nr:hypothetical protein [Lachnospiraceae bacterium]
MAPKTVSTSVGVGTRKTNSMGNGTGNNDLPPAGSSRLPSPSETEEMMPPPTLRKLDLTDDEPQREGTESGSTESDAEDIDPVNMATGEYICKDKDFILPDMGGEYSLTRRYTGPSKKKPDRSLGKAWALSTDTFVTEEENAATVTMPNGKTAEYIKRSSRYINKKSGTKKFTLEKTENGYIFTDSTVKVKYYYDETGKIEKKTDRNGNTTDYIYNGYGIEKIILPTGYTLTFKRENMKIASATDSAGRTVRYEYEKGLLTKVTRCDGTEIKYTYDENENLKTITDGMGCTYLENWYDDSHRVIRQKTADGMHCTCTYDEKSSTNTVTEEENGAVTQYKYDENYDITCIKYPDGSEETRKLDKYGNISETTDRCGAVTSYTYDIKGNLLVKKEPSGLITRYEYGREGCTKTRDNAGRQTVYKRDENGNITEERKLLDENTGKESVTEYDYDGYGRITQKNENGRTTKYKYSGTFPYPVLVTSPDGTETRKGYDAAGRLAEKATEDKTEKYTYTEYNKVKTYEDGEGGVTEYKYDKSWRLIEIIRPGLEKGEQYGYDCMDRLIAEEDACGRKTIYKRNAYGDIIEIRKCGTKESDAIEDCNAIKNNCMGESITYEYDNCHRIMKKNIGTYGSETYKYDNCGRIIGKAVSEIGRHEGGNRGYEYTRDSAGRITLVKDPYGNITDAYTYDLHGNVKKHIHSPLVLKTMAEAGGTAQEDRYPGDIYTYNKTSLMMSKKELLTITKEGTTLYCINIYRYDADGNLITEKTYAEPQPITDIPQCNKKQLHGRVRTIERKYDECGRLKEISDSEGAKAIYEYDRHGRKTKETAVQDSEKSRITEYEYDRCDRLKTQRVIEKQKSAPQQREKLQRRNGNRFLESRKIPKEPEITEKLIEETEYCYDKSGNIIKAVMPDGLTVTYTYDESDRKTSVIASDGKNKEAARKNTYGYDGYGYVSEKTENGITTRYENDAFGNILKEKHADGGTTVYKYDIDGRCICIITPEENRKKEENAASCTAMGTTTEYDLCGRPVKTISPDGAILEENTYDSSGNILMQKNADGNSIKYVYDAGGRIKFIVTAAGIRREYTYDAMGNITAQSVGEEAVYYQTDMWGHVLEIRAAEDIKEKYEYDYMGNLTAATDGEGRRREYHKDIQGNTYRITYADGSVEIFEYDAAGRPVSKTYRSGKKELYSYDIFGGLTKIKAEPKYTSENTWETSIGSRESEKYTYEYWGDGRIKSASGGGIKYIYEYDECGRLNSKSACGRTLIKYEYDLNGNKTAVTDVTGKTTLYEYDITDRLTIIRENDRVLAEYTYTPCGKVSEIKCGDIKTEYRYDPDGRNAGIKVTVSGSVISDIRYSYDNSGNCIKKANSADGLNVVTEYGYDGIGRLINVNNASIIETYAYDRAGNRTEHKINDGTTEKYTYNEVNELLSMERSKKQGSENDIRNFTYDPDGNMTSDGRGIYKYDSLNRMTEAVMEDGRKLTCRYDAEGLRHETEENGNLIRFIYSGKDAVCEETDDNITRYIRGNGSLVASDSENARTYYHYACDSLGSITHVIAGNEFGNGDVNSRILCRYEYDAFGNTVNAEETITNRYGFTGEIHDGITDMYYLRARYYSPYIGRFTQTDTYHGDGLNLYVYAGNDPVKYVDPSGHKCKKSVSGIIQGDSNFDENDNFLEIKFPEWRPGDSITKMTPDGNYPSWDTIRKRYWMNRAFFDPDSFSPQNIGRMKNGLAPVARVIVKDRKTGTIYEKLVSKDIHHANGNRGIPGFDEPIYLREVWPWEHENLFPPGRKVNYDFIKFK